MTVRTRSLLALCLAVLLALSLVGCAPKTEPVASTEPSAAPVESAVSAESDKKVIDHNAEGVVNFLHIYPEHQKTMDKTYEVIKRDNPNMVINETVVPWNEATKTIQTAAASDEMYDVFFMWSSQVPGYNDLGLLLDLTPYMTDEWRNTFLNDAVLQEYSVGDQILGIPLRGTGVLLIYNKTMFDEHGWQIPTTQEELVALCDQILSEGIQPISAPGKPNGFQLESARGRVFDHIVYMAGRIEDPDRLTNRVTEWDGLRAQSAEIVKDWYKAGYFGANALGIEREEGQTVFATGTSAMLLCNNNELTALHEMVDAAGQFEIGSFMWPAPAACDKVLFTSAGFGDGWGAWSGSEYPDAAAAFLMSFCSKDAMTYWGNDELCCVASGEVTYNDPVQQSFAEQFAQGGEYRVVADYNSGNLGDLTGQAFADYLASDTMTADEYETTVEQLTVRAIEDAEE